MIARSTNPMRVMVVDDSQDTANILALLLTMSGHEVPTLYDGPTAIEMAQEFLPQAILLNLGLPRLDGYAVARRIRELPAIKHAVLIALTGYARAEERQRSFLAGFNFHLGNPLILER